MTWSLKYKRSINCKKPKGFSQKQYCDRQARGGRRLSSLEGAKKTCGYVIWSSFPRGQRREAIKIAGRDGGLSLKEIRCHWDRCAATFLGPDDKPMARARAYKTLKSLKRKIKKFSGKPHAAPCRRS